MDDPQTAESIGCCTPQRAGSAAVPAPGRGQVVRASPVDHEFIDLLGGIFRMGSDEPTRFPADGEGPSREVVVEPFRISPHAVSNARFAEFVDATGYVTDAERFGWSFVFHLFLPDDFEPTRSVQGAPWWRQVYGATWRHPAGPQTGIADLADHPVVHVSWTDADNYCTWAGVRLPSEAEWEYAARGGLAQCRYPWGDEFAPEGKTMCNIFEGEFPLTNSAEDGYIGTAPIDAFAPNGYGLFNVAGNVWEWCGDLPASLSDPDENPKFVDRAPGVGTHPIRGGSYLCHDSYCNRYRVAARSSNAADSSTGNMGFRVAAG